MNDSKNTEIEALSKEKIHAEIAKLIAETSRINAEAGKLTKEAFWYPLLIATGFVGAIIALTKLFL